MSMSDSDLLALGKQVHNLFDNCRNNVSVYGVGWEDGTIIDLDHYACHMGLMKRDMWGGDVRQVALDSTGKGPVVISNQVQYHYCDDGRQLNKKERYKFFSFLFTESVFAECYVPQDPGKCDEDGITVRTDLPANLVVAACIATRQAWEYADIGKTVLRLIEYGVEPRKAHLAAHVITVDKDGSWEGRWVGGHIAVYSNYMGKTAVSNFLSGTLDKKIALNKLTYRKARNYREIPEMWGPDEDERFRVPCEDRSGVVMTSDPFQFIKQVGEIKTRDVVDAVERAFERILK